MAKKAFCVGINTYPMRGANLNGCVNDANGWAQLLVDHFDFNRKDVALLTDRAATKQGMVKGLEKLLRGAAPGDVLVFTNSSHGSYVADLDGDEPDRYDEVICPYDIKQNRLVDDELWELLDAVPRRVHVTVISDSCHSGNVTRVAPNEILPGLTFDDHRRPRFLSPAYWSKPRARAAGAARVISDAAAAKPRTSRPQSSMKHVLLSGCKDSELSWDAEIGGVFHGAMSYSAFDIIKRARYKITYEALGKKLLTAVPGAGYPQHPQVEGSAANRHRQIFV